MLRRPRRSRACPGRNASSAVPAPDAFEKAATLSSKRRLCSSALLHTTPRSCCLPEQPFFFLLLCVQAITR